ncbi:MAG: GNAT family N-acetyltransferase [Candidatus Obscuribacterales bacterium]|nr:GNAT family N-acetyltransferase [Candidatus Obscuribacterales bacterium]
MSAIQMRLRPFQRDELKYYDLWMASAEVCGPYVELEKHTLEELQADFDIDKWQSNRLRRWLLFNELDGALMGFAHAWEFEKYESHQEFGRILLPEYRGKGLGLPMLRLILDTIFDETKVDRLQTMTACDNEAVLKCWKNAGIRIEGRLREYMTLRGRYVDVFLGGILRKEWPSS